MEFMTVSVLLGKAILKLGQLLQGEYELQKNLRMNIEFLMKELETTQAALCIWYEVPTEQLNVPVKIWIQDVQELYYDMDVVIQSFLRSRTSRLPPSKDKLKNMLAVGEKMKDMLAVGELHQIYGPSFKEIKERVTQLAERRDRYIVDCINTVTTVGRRRPPIYVNRVDLVGIHGARDELVRKLITGDDMPPQQQRIVSIFGFGGLGKTTLAQAVYEELQWQFDCTAFVTVSRNPDMKKCLKDMLCELDRERFGDIQYGKLDERCLIDAIREFLSNKRYFIIIDDIWEISSWDKIKRALPDNNTGCGIITTTRQIRIASHIGCAYEMRPLCQDSSSALLRRRIFGIHPGKGLDKGMINVSNRILKKCAGVPLAIITIAGLLASRRNAPEWEEVCQTIDTGMENGDYVDNLIKILTYSYYDLPSHLKTCLLYLCIFPEGFQIERDRLIWMWIAKGFIQCKEPGCLFNLGKSYFNELVKRSMIQPVSYYDDNVEIRNCRVHDMMLEVIHSLSSKENFVLRLPLQNWTDHIMTKDTWSRKLCSTKDTWRLRCLTIWRSSTKDAWSRKLRSFVFFPYDLHRQMMALQSFKFLRELDLRGCDLSHGCYLEYLGCLFHLWYLRPNGTRIDDLPGEVGQLKFLEALYIENISRLPLSVSQLTHLLCLSVGRKTRVPNGPVVFVLGAKPRLTCIEFDFYVREVTEMASNNNYDGFDFGLGNLPSLQQVKVVLRSRGASKEEVEQAKAVMTKVVKIHPNQPTLQIAFDTEDGKGCVKEVCNLRRKYNIESVADKSVANTVYPHLLAQCMKKTELIGVDEAIDDLVKILLQGNEVSKQHGKIVSIVGLAGLGKTSLASALYGKLRSQFDCCAFVTVTQNPNMKKLFKSILYQLGKINIASVQEMWDERLLIYELIEFLQKKRYLMIIDDIRDISLWQIIRCALPDNRCGYRIITTTREIDIAEQVGDVYRLKPLGLQNSKALLYRRIFGNEDKYSPDEQLAEVSDKIIMTCAGIPLAIIVIAGLLARKGRNKMEWYNVYNSIVTALQDNTDVNNVELILTLSFNDLPIHLKNCLSYLSLFPEDYDIHKDRLIRLWIAEGFIQCEKQEEGLFELGNSYFYELLIRSMIQPVYKRWYYDITEYCRVHDMVLDLCYLSSKGKYVTVLNYLRHTLPSKEIRWLSFQNSMVSHATHRATVSMQQVTSVVVFPSAINLMPALLSFRDLRVLDLQSCHLSQGCSLKYLGTLIQLRYLGLRDTGITQLTEEIGNLKFLQTLDVTSNEISSLPPTVVHLKNIMCLNIDSWTRVPNAIGSLTSLEELSMLCIDDSTGTIEELGQLTGLRVLGIDYRATWNVHSLEKPPVECLHKLQNVQNLSVSVFGEYKLDSWVPPKHIRRLELKGCFSSPLRTWVNESHLLNLLFLSMEVQKLRQEDLEILGRLPALIYLDLEVNKQNLGTVRRLVIGDCSFPCLVQCMLRGNVAPVMFQQGAMPKLERLHLTFPVREMRETADSKAGFDLGLENLPSLQDVTFLVRRGGAIEADVEEAETALRHAIESHPNHPTLEIYADDAEDE